MRLSELTIELGKVPDELIQYCIGVADTLDLHDEISKTQEHAFYNLVYRYDATTEFFTPTNYFGSLIPPLDSLQKDLDPFYNWLINTHFSDHVIFRSQVILSPPGAQVLPHLDPRLYHKFSHRVHCVLKTNSGCRNLHFLPESNYDISYFHMKEGYLFDLDNIIPHASFNYGDADRLHIIIDIMPRSKVHEHRELWTNDTNYTPKEIQDEYNVHVKKITERYGDKDALRSVYKASIGQS